MSTERSNERRNIVRLPQNSHYINLNWGKPSPSLLPTDALLAASQKVLSQPSVWETALSYGDSDGYLPLRRSISAWLHRFYGGKQDPNQICITGGASQNLMNVLAVLTDPLETKAVWMTNPCFFLACRMFEDAGFNGKLKGIREGDGGELDLNELERHMEEMDKTPHPQKENTSIKPNHPSRKIYTHVIYVVPTFSNPSGKSMPLSCRNDLVRLARKHNALIISDDIYDCLQWEEEAARTHQPSSSSSSQTNDPLKSRQSKNQNLAPPRLVDIDRALPTLASDPKAFRHTLSNGSFSKIVAPGVRTGWTDASPAICGALASCGASISGGCPSQYMAAVLHELMMMDEGRWLDRHLSGTLVPAYKHRRAVLVAAIDRFLRPLGCQCGKVGGDAPEDTDALVGGFFVWVSLPYGMQGTVMAERAREVENLVVPPGRWFTVAGDQEGSDHEDNVRLSFSFVSENDLIEGVRRLGRIIQTLLGD